MNVPNTRPSNLLAQTFRTLGSMVGNQGMQIAAGIVLSRIYGPPGKGLVTYAGIVILGVIAIADGLGSSIARQCGDDAAKVSASYSAALRIIYAVSLLAFVPLELLGLFAPGQHALLYVGIAFPFALYAQTVSGFHLIASRVGRTNLASLFTNAGAALAMLVTMLVARPSIDIILAIWTAGYVGGAAIIHQGLGSRRSAVASYPQPFGLKVRFAISASTASLMTFLASRADVFIVAATLSPTSLGNYTLALAFGELMWQLGRAISWSAYGRVATAPFGLAAVLAARITRIVLAVEALAAIAAFAFGPFVLKIVYGPAFSAAGPVLRILIPGMALYAADAILTYFITVKVGRPDLILRIEAATLIACTVCSLATISHYGLIAPAIATTLAYFASFTAKLVIFARSTGIPVRTLLLLKATDLRRQSEALSDRGPAVA